MNTQTPTLEKTSSTRTMSVGFNDRAFVRLAAAIIDEPEEVVLASLLAKRSKPENLSCNLDFGLRNVN
ncbi:hypothetical protein N9B73_02860 [Verrucomicrobiales bacterium]|jgi:hypothetical protein|nr:hypothetical protein [Verrucomicrobiales bacterium]